jgi:hypothetical protein
MCHLHFLQQPAQRVGVLRDNFAGAPLSSFAETGTEQIQGSANLEYPARSRSLSKIAIIYISSSSLSLTVSSVQLARIPEIVPNDEETAAA